MSRSAVSIAFVCSLLVSRAAASQEIENNTTLAENAVEMSESAEPSSGSALATTGAVIPGVLLHGFGHYLAGDKKTAFKLARYELIGLGMMAASGLYIGLSGGSRYGNEVTIPLLVSGSGIFINSWLADIYGSATAGTARERRALPNFALSLDYAYIRNSVFRYDHFSVAEGRFTLGKASLQPSVWTALTANNQRARLPVRYALTKNSVGQGLELQTALTYHHFGEEGFSNYTGEIGLGFRIDNRYFGSALAGSYSSLSIGYGLEHTEYELDIEGDNRGLLLGSFAYGLYLPKGGQLEGYYEHRRDTFSSGISPSSRNGSGFLGHFGLKLRQPLHSRFALRAQAELGSAWVFSTGVEYGFGK